MAMFHPKNLLVCIFRTKLPPIPVRLPLIPTNCPVFLRKKQNNGKKVNKHISNKTNTNNLTLFLIFIEHATLFPWDRCDWRDGARHVPDAPRLNYCFFFLSSSRALVIRSLMPPSLMKAVSCCLICCFSR
jgi:hypothetical protein